MHMFRRYRIKNANLNIFHGLVTLNLGQGHQDVYSLGLLPTMYLCKFGRNPCICSEDTANLNNFHGLVILKIRSR